MTASDFSLDKFNTNFGEHGGARSYLFVWEPSLKIGNNGNYRYNVKATSLPESSVEEIPIHWQGMSNKLPGPRTYTDWTITFNSDNGWTLRKYFEDWMNLINNWKDSTFASKIDDYSSTQTLKLLDYDLGTSKTIKLINAWPKSIGPITLDYSSQEIAQFDVTFAYQYFTME